MTRRSAAICLTAAALLATSAQAAPTIVPYLGYLTYDGGAAVSQTVDVTVTVYSADVGGSILWGPHLFDNVAVISGLFTLPLGGASSPDLAAALDSGGQLWLEFDVDGATMSPRQQILSVPFARRAEDASQLGGIPAAAYTQTADLPSVALSGSYQDLLDVPEGLLEGLGQTGAIAVFTGPRELGSSSITETAGLVGVGVPSPAMQLDVGGGVKLGMVSQACSPALAGTLRWTGTALGRWSRTFPRAPSRRA